MKGHIQKRGDNWRLKFDLGRDPATGRRLTRYISFRGTKREAQTELARLISCVSSGSFIDPSKLTLADYLRSWVGQAETKSLSAKTAERYRGLIENQIIPHLGALLLQKVRPAHVAAWHATLLTKGRQDESPLAARTVGHAHRVLLKALGDAVRQEALLRNPAAAVPPPKVTGSEISILSSDQVPPVLDGLRNTPIFVPIVILLATGMRRGELMGLRWGDIDLDLAKVRVDRAVEKTKAYGLRLKVPKTKHGRRVISLPASGVEALRQHRKAELERRMALGLGKLPDDAFVFGNLDGSLRDPDRITQDFRRYSAAKGLPRVTLHALRHGHASALISSGQDVVTVSRRLGHGSPNVTLAIYAHLFDNSDDRAAKAIDVVLTAAPATAPVVKDTKF